MFQAIQLERTDNVATVITEIAKATVITVQAPSKLFSITSNDAIPFGHKVALVDIRKGETVTKYGRPIGRATCNIMEGGLVGVHNIEGMRGRGDLEGGMSE